MVRGVLNQEKLTSIKGDCGVQRKGKQAMCKGKNMSRLRRREGEKVQKERGEDTG